MDSRWTRAGASENASPWPIALAALGALLVAYRGLWLESAGLDSDAIFFTPGRLPATVVLAVSAWLLWRRRARLAPARSARQPALRLATLPLLLAAGTASFVWALLSGKSDLLLLSLALNAVAAATALAGGRGARAAMLPSCVLALGMRLPKPLEDELVWRLQTGTARAAGAVLDAVGRDFVQSGVILRNEAHTFHVIDSCSGLNGIAILILVGVIVRELFSESDPWAWLVVACAPAVGFGLNVLRVAWIAASPDPEALAGPQGDHTVQGLAVVMTGTAMLYALGWSLSGPLFARQPSDRPHPQADPDRWRGGCRGLGWPAFWLAGLLMLSWTLQPFPPPPPLRARVSIDLSEQKDGWTSSEAPRDLFFTGSFAGGVHRRYQRTSPTLRTPDIVDVLVGFEDPNQGIGATRLVSSKLLVPGPEWELERKKDDRIWLLDQDVEQALAARRPGSERALVIAWRVRDRGLLAEAGRSLLALDAGPLRRVPPRIVVRLVAYAPHDGQLALDRAAQQIDRFVRSFRDELSALSRFRSRQVPVTARR